MIVLFPLNARMTGVAIQRRALAAGLSPTDARARARQAERLVLTGKASPAALLARRGTRPNPGPEVA